MEDVFFTEEECKNIINLTNILDKVKEKSFLGNLNSHNNEISYDVWNVNRDDSTQWIFNKLHKFFTSNTNIEIKSELNQVHIHKFIKGEKFTRHIDNYYPTQQHNIGVCLNDDYGGGEFVLFNPNLTLPKKTGSIYTFESRREHEVKEITSGERWSLISFLHTYHLKYKINKFI